MTRKLLSAAAVMVAVFFTGSIVAQAADVTFGGQLRPRYEVLHQSESTGVNNAFVTMRTRLNTNVKIDENTSAFLQFQMNSTWGFGGGILSQSLKPVHFGLASAQVIDEIKVTWPSGKIERIYNVPVNQTLRLKESDNTRVTGVEDEIAADSFEVYNYPNPFDNSTTFHFKLAKPGVLDLRIFSIAGKELFQVTRGMVCPSPKTRCGDA